MEEWQKDHIGTHRSELINLVNPIGSDLLADLKKPSGIFSEYDKQFVKCKSNLPLEIADRLFDAAINKLGAYDELTILFTKYNLCGAAAILLKGYQENKKPLPEKWLTADKPDELKIRFCPMQLIKSATFIVHENHLTLENLVGKDGSEEIYEKANALNLSHPSINKPILLTRKKVSPEDPPKYYIPRSFTYRSKLDEKIFREDVTKDHIFLVKGNKSVLARATRHNFDIEECRKQLQKLTVRFLVEEEDEDYFENICRIATTPVHLIKSENDAFNFIKSSRDMHVFQGFIKEDGKNFEESEVAKMMASTSTSFSLCIADSPGIGKTFVLRSLAARIKEICSNAVVLFISLYDFISHIQVKQIQSSSVCDMISHFSTDHEVTKLVFQKMMDSNMNEFYLFLDGYDEILEHHLDLADSILNRLRGLVNTKIIVTTRPHRKFRLESIFNHLSFEMEPFSKTNQIDFLTKYWVSESGAEETENLKIFAQDCLKALKVKMTDKEKKLTGIPLQCMLLAEVYGEDAKLASKRKAPFKDTMKESSFFEMYTNLVKKKFEKIPENEKDAKQSYIDAHIHDAVLLLFPNWLPRFRRFLSRRKNVKDSTMYAIGLIEFSSSTNTRRFLHRTFAEFFLAEFIIKNLKISVFAEFLLEEIFGKKGTYVAKSKSNLSLTLCKHPVIVYFLELQLRIILTNNKDEFLDTLSVTQIIEENVCTALIVSCCDNLETFFDFFARIFRRFNLDNVQEFRDTYFKHLLHIVVEKSENGDLVKRIVNLMESIFNVSLGYHVFENNYKFGDGLEIPMTTPLHVAVSQGKYNTARYLLNKYEEDIKAIKYLMHACVFNSSGNSKSMIEDKLTIIDFLAGKNSNWLNEIYDNKTPILQLNVHVELIQDLVKRGVDINTYSDYYGTILHTGGDKNTFKNLFNFALENGFSLINHTAIYHTTPIMAAISRFDSIDYEALELFHSVGANFDAQDEGGNSVLFYAVKYCKNVEFVGKVLKFVTNVNSTNKEGQNIAHYLVASSNNHTLAVELLKLLESRGFKLFHKKDSRGLTPLSVAKDFGIDDEELLKFLCERESICSTRVVIPPAVLLTPLVMFYFLKK